VKGMNGKVRLCVTRFVLPGLATILFAALLGSAPSAGLAAALPAPAAVHDLNTARGRHTATLLPDGHAVAGRPPAGRRRVER